MSVAATTLRIAEDRNLLLHKVDGRSEEELVTPYLVHGGPLGDFCDSLRDLVAHVSMWDEICLAALTEARRGRSHWVLRDAWTAPGVGQRINRAGVAAGRELPVDALVQRMEVVRDALLAEIGCYDEEEWLETMPSDENGRSMGALSQYAMTVPSHEPYWHAAIHLGELNLRYESVRILEQ